MDQERGELREVPDGEDNGDVSENPAGSDRDGLRNDGAGAPQSGPEPAPKRTDEPDERPSWLEVILPVIVVLVLATLVMLWNIIAGLVVLIIGIGVILSWVIQRRGPHEPGE